MAQQGWSSLPADLVNRVADGLLATSDVDYYTDLRAVYHHWRSSTDDPRSNPQEPRLRPNRWILLDERKVSSSTTDRGPFLFVNTATGRFLRRSLSLLHDPGHAFVKGTTDDLLVLVATDPPHAVSVLNPFTGSLIRFAAPLTGDPQEAEFTVDVVGSSPTLVLFSNRQWWMYWVDPQSESFSMSIDIHNDFPASRVPQIVAAAGQRAAVKHDNVHVAQNIFDQVRSLKYVDEDCRCYVVVVAGGDILAVMKREISMDVHVLSDVFRIDAAGNVMERVKSIDNQALFLSARCLVVDTDCFPTIEANCAYLQHIGIAERYIYKFNIGICDNEEPELVSVAMDSDFPWRGSMGPFTLTQILSNYTIDIPGHSPRWESCRIYYNLRDEYYHEYISYI